MMNFISDAFTAILRSIKAMSTTTVTARSATMPTPTRISDDATIKPNVIAVQHVRMVATTTANEAARKNSGNNFYNNIGNGNPTQSQITRVNVVTAMPPELVALTAKEVAQTALTSAA